MIWAYVGAGALAAGLAGGYYLRDLQADADDKARLEQANKDAMRRAENADRASATYESAKDATQARERVVIKEVTRVVTRPVYRNECVDADGLRILADDIAARTAPRQPAPALPDAARAD